MRFVRPGWGGWWMVAGMLLFLLMGTRPVRADGIVVRGNTVLSKSEIQEVLAPYQGRAVTPAEVQNVAARLTQVYAKKGYFLTRAYVPVSGVVEGVAQIAVLEGRIGEIKVRGNRHYSQRLIRRYLEPLRRESVARFGTMQKAVMLLNELPDMKARVLLRPGREVATTDVLLDVDDGTPRHATVDYNNFGNRYVGVNRAGLALTDGNLTGAGDSLALKATQSFPATRTPPVYQAGYSFSLDSQDRRLGVAYTNGLFVLGRDLTQLDVRSRAAVYGLAYSDPWLRREDASATFTAGFFSKSFLNTLMGAAGTADEIRNITLGCHGDWTAGGGRNLWSVALERGLDGFAGGSANDNPRASRPGAGDNFTVVDFDLARVQPLGSPLRLIARASGQLASTGLVAGEQYVLGGPDTVRGYPLAELLGDSGYAMSAEVRLPLVQREHSDLQAEAFIDHGGAWLKSPSRGQPAAHFLTGAGLGLRGTSGQTSAVLEIGYPLMPASNSVGTTPVLYAQFSATF